MIRISTLRTLTGRMNLRNRRTKEKYCLFVILMSFFMICVGMVYFLPDLRAKTTTGVHDAYQKIPELFLAPHLPPPPHGAELRLNGLEGYPGSGSPQHVVPRPMLPPRGRDEDREKLYAKIRQDLEQEDQRVLAKPRIFDGPSTSTTTTTKIPQVDGRGHLQRMSPSSVSGSHHISSPRNVHPHPALHTVEHAFPAGNSYFHRSNFTKPVVFGGEDPNGAVRSKRNVIRQMMKDSWDNYVTHAWGENELRPLTHKGHSASIFGPSKIGATIVDALDTLYIMGLHEEYQVARDWVAKDLNFDTVRAEVSVFETNIRFVGGLLTMFALTGDVMYKDKAYHLAKKLLPAFETPTGIPMALISLGSGASKNYGWASSGSSILSEFGTLHLEFLYLSDITGDPIFKEKVFKIRETMKQIEKPKGLYFNYVHPRMAKFTQNHVSMGALGDSFYEYLLKAYVQAGDIEAREMYDAAMEAFEKNGLIRYSKGGLLYIAEMRYDRIESKMDHLACFAGGLFALGAHTDPNLVGPEKNSARANRHMKIAEGITNTCHESYIRTQTRLGPESFRFSDAIEARAQRPNEKYYILRPEVIESYFIMWRLTGDQKYRDWGWDSAQAIEQHCKAGPGGGYSGLRNVYSKDPQQDDVQQSFFLAETLKYLYLLFSSNDLIDLDYWVFNTEAHPLPVKGLNPYYRPSPNASS
ncbi:mannosyl-oligosaccharide 1,2-alpha-mannosidase IA isoform X2 [Folsomia candida]|uniref:mannosyl-oligosaccharide 1,2-alpha-mannosidase IA isoform X2 n=1 Tax=Folsomia candida TaxID=158441 RepID=UPI000B8F092D|nr:mannosyl-oligosaccharide 1,2-alpha-mannosidase IA isoform X2 [Folsomia candida]